MKIILDFFIYDNVLRYLTCKLVYFRVESLLQHLYMYKSKSPFFQVPTRIPLLL